jgi:[histone H3]-lysine36 N-dimethyltransferase SETMAR
MELSPVHFRAMIFYDFKRGLDYTDSYKNLTEAFGDQAPSKKTVFNWFREFSRGRLSFEDDPRSGRPAETATEDNIRRVHAFIEEFRNATYVEIEAELGIDARAIDCILHEHLGVTKKVSRRIPHLFTDEQKLARVDWCQFMQEKFNGGTSKSVGDMITGDETWIYAYDPETKQQWTVWVFEDEPPPTKVTRQRSVAKQMVAFFQEIRTSGGGAAGCWSYCYCGMVQYSLPTQGVL